MMGPQFMDPTGIPSNAFVAAICILVAAAHFQYKRYRRTGELCQPILTIILTAYCLHIISVILFDWPPNIFTYLKLPPTVPAELLRETLLRRAALPPDATLPDSLELLLSRLSSVDIRSYYVRFGQATIQHCAWCESYKDYVIYMLSSTFPAYLAQVILLFILTITGSGHERWRKLASCAVIGIAALESFFVVNLEFSLLEDVSKVIMWHDFVWLVRQLLFLIVPLVTHFAPQSSPSPSPSPMLSIYATRDLLDKDLKRFLSLRYMRGAIMRDPTLRGAAIEWWEQQRVEGEWAREDQHVRHVAEQLGKGFSVPREGAGSDEAVVEGRQRTIARTAVTQMMSDGLAPS
ncbi:hypothetical protein OBBRIDRAFT_792432 [Obba rivulosa]|uniref:Uncharacterized protein n=1 Tax=Obba rivulosa TaxID=1052685 RepID=A0A8E2DLQ2_9APHY|nr:hypothetical protein OBBRIDRAFT_792432 [Obba rivulosa]